MHSNIGFSAPTTSLTASSRAGSSYSLRPAPTHINKGCITNSYKNCKRSTVLSHDAWHHKECFTIKCCTPQPYRAAKVPYRTLHFCAGCAIMLTGLFFLTQEFVVITFVSEICHAWRTLFSEMLLCVTLSSLILLDLCIHIHCLFFLHTCKINFSCVFLPVLLARIVLHML